MFIFEIRKEYKHPRSEEYWFIDKITYRYGSKELALNFLEAKYKGLPHFRIDPNTVIVFRNYPMYGEIHEEKDTITLLG